MQIVDCIQGTDEWLSLRLGKVTASRFKDILAKGRGSSPSKVRESYMYQLAAETLTGQVQDSFTNSSMEWGTETEEQARSYYELMESCEVTQIGFAVYNDRIGASPDGLVGDNGCLEIKCPKTSTQIQRVLKDQFPAEYKAQVQGQLWVCEKEWCDFISFDPRINGPASYFKKRVHRDDVYIKSLEKEINKFLEELDEMLIKLNPEIAERVL